MTKNGIITLIIISLAGLGMILVFTKVKKTAPTTTIEQTTENSVGSISTTPPTSNGANDQSAAMETIKEVAEITLSIMSPLSGSSVTGSKVTVKGKTSPKAEVFANEAEGFADGSGNFSLSVALDEGENSIIITAVDVNGKVAEKEILITFDAGE